MEEADEALKEEEMEVRHFQSLSIVPTICLFPALPQILALVNGSKDTGLDWTVNLEHFLCNSARR